MIVGEEQDPLEHRDIFARMVLANEGEEVISVGRLFQEFTPRELRSVGRMRRRRIAVLLTIVEDPLEVVLSTFDGTDVWMEGGAVIGDVEETLVTGVEFAVK